ncbi:MAG: hypothetical protein OXR73_26260 [Myxococcales bacterium]|nr:hypothetical protein [Myxococcales bacterium]
MDCQQCQAHLVDLVCGELPPALVAEVEAELARCADCRALHNRLRDGLTLGAQLPEVQPPQALRERLMAVGDAALAGTSSMVGTDPSGPVGPRSVAGDSRSSWGGFWAELGRLLMGRQVAMATIMVLVVAGTLWMVPGRHQKPKTVGVTVAGPQPGDVMQGDDTAGQVGRPEAVPNRLAGAPPTVEAKAARGLERPAGTRGQRQVARAAASRSGRRENARRKPPVPPADQEELAALGAGRRQAMRKRVRPAQPRLEAAPSAPRARAATGALAGAAAATESTVPPAAAVVAEARRLVAGGRLEQAISRLAAALGNARKRVDRTVLRRELAMILLSDGRCEAGLRQLGRVPKNARTAALMRASDACLKQKQVR